MVQIIPKIALKEHVITQALIAVIRNLTTIACISGHREEAEGVNGWCQPTLVPCYPMSTPLGGEFPAAKWLENCPQNFCNYVWQTRGVK